MSVAGAPGQGAIVIGGSAGVGRAVVAALVADGYRVGVVARGQDRLGTIEREGDGRIACAAADVADDVALRAAVDRLVAQIGPPAVWVNCAMLTSYAPFVQMPAEEFRRIGDVTYLGQVNGTRAALAVMERGAIVNVGSALGYRSIPFQSAYCGAKAAVNGFTQSLRSELIRAGRDITLSLVQLPAVNTPQFDWARNRLPHMPQPAPPIFQPEVAARAVMRAARTGAREIFVGLPVIQLIFGNFALPAFLDRKFASDGADMQTTATPDPGGRPDNLDAPVAHAATARGRFDDRAKDSALIVDGDAVRRAVFFGGAALLVVAGLLMGLVLG